MTTVAILLTGFTIGLAGSIHCVGMCGPIALGVVSRTGERSHYLLYLLGKTLSYALMGLILGAVGNQFALAGFQQVLTIVSGLFIVLIFFVSKYSEIQIPFFTAALGKLRLVLYSLLGNTNKAWFSFELGVINGWLPCGLVYMALMTALATGDLSLSSLHMAAFGIGTMPLMLFLMLTGRSIPPSTRNLINRWLPWLILLTGLLMILRGLSLGIPYLSPSLDGKSNCL